MKNTNISITVIIPTYNRVNTLKQTLSVLETTQDSPEEVLIIDQTLNKSMATEIKTICLKSSLNVRYLFLNYPSSTSARNVGIRESKGDILLFLDDDVDVNIDTFTNIRTLFSNPRIAMIGGLDKSIYSFNSYKSYLFDKASCRKRRVGHMTSAIYGRFPLLCGELTPTEWAMGFCFAVRRECVINWKLEFEEKFRYYAYAEDLDFTYGYYTIAKKHNMDCYFSSKLLVNHNVSQEYRTPNKMTTFMMILHREYIRNKYFKKSLWHRFAVDWSNWGDFLYRLIKLERPTDVINAILFYKKYKTDILKGVFHYDKFLDK